MPELAPIAAPKQLVVEGIDAVVFFRALLREIGLANIQVQNFGGVDELRGFLKGLQRQDGFAQMVVSLGIARDAERDPTSAFQSVCSALRGAGLTDPSQIETFEGSDPKVGVLILPDAKTPGMLETLCLRAVDDDPVMPCVDEYFNCVDQRLPSAESPRILEKARVQVFLASRREPVSPSRWAAHRGYWPWDDPVFNHVKQFLSSL
jgi:hypothetical protein